jgi:hypothetical protein
MVLLVEKEHRAGVLRSYASRIENLDKSMRQPSTFKKLIGGVKVVRIRKVSEGR